MATGGDRNEVWMLSATKSPKNSGSMLKVFNSGRKIGMKMTMISVHSNGQPRMKMMICARIMKPVGVRFIHNTNFSIGSWPPRYANTAENVNEPMNSQHTIAVVRAVKNTDSLSWFNVNEVIGMNAIPT